MENTKKVANLQVGQIINGNCEVLAVKQASKHPDDVHLQYVLCKKPASFGVQYVTWLYNEHGQGVHHGHYFDATHAVYGLGMTDEEALAHARTNFRGRG